ncbi:hypothetical protein [Acidithiobacillus thiooxidans]|uniref:hypothetical protein n=1 Tax=Acidithiobacillus thiooxidans TaxID=930 RepID=UPI0024320BB4|nr:hypothetical protein [Acidithiobacillus thiooxidans]
MTNNEVISGVLAASVLLGGAGLCFQPQQAVSPSFSSGTIVESHVANGTYETTGQERQYLAEFMDLAFVEMAKHQISQDNGDMPYFHDLWDLYDSGHAILKL